MKKLPKTKSVRLAEKLLHIRSKLNLSQAEMLVRLGFSDELFRSNISQYELGMRVPALTVVLEYARVAGVSMEALVDDDIDLPESLSAAGTKTSPKRSAKR